MDFQQPLIYGRISLPGEQERGFREVFPLVQIPDVQGGRGRFRKDSLTLNNFTGCAGQHLFRGDRLPADTYGDLFIPEPVGRLIRRAKVVNEGGRIVVKNATPGTEFIRSSDANFRPVNAATGPDGCLYIVDMYRGIIQEGNWVRKGSYLRGVVEQHGLDKNIGRGRIYRLVHESTKRGPQPRMLDQRSAELVPYLSHPNGWWRDTAQKLIVVRNDQTAVPALMRLARDKQRPYGRLHALWTLDGLGEFDPVLIGERLADPDPRIRAAAIRLCETPLLAGDNQMVSRLAPLAGDPDPNVGIQLVLTLARCAPANGIDLVDRVRATHSDNPNVAAIIRQSHARIEEARRLRQQNEFLVAGKTNYETLCVSCHALDAKGTAVPGSDIKLGPSLVGSPRALGKKDIPIRIMLKGMTGELDGKTYPGPMLPLESYDDQWIAATLTYVRKSFGNNASAVTPEEVAAVRAAVKDRKTFWDSREILAMQPIPVSEMESWTVSASHNAGNCQNALDGNQGSRWDTGCTQAPGMWFQFDMKRPRKLTSLVLDTKNSSMDYPRDYTVHVSKDGTAWSEPVARGKGTNPVTEIVLPALETQYVRINQHGRSPGKFWSIHRLEVYTE